MNALEIHGAGLVDEHDRIRHSLRDHEFSDYLAKVVAAAAIAMVGHEALVRI